VGAEDVAGHQVGRELDAGEPQAEDLGEGLDHGGLADARHALEEDVPAAEDADEDEPLEVGLAEQDAAHLIEDAADALGGRTEFLGLKHGRRLFHGESFLMPASREARGYGSDLSK